MEILNNPWVIGIGGGVLSGFIVALVTRYLFSRRENREYLQKVSAVNREIVYALRPGISEGEIPSEEVLESLIKATSRKYKVDASDVYSSRQIAEELIKDIMDSNFISAETKKRYCDNLAHLVKESCAEEVKELRKPEHSQAASELRQRMVMQMSVVLGVTVSMMTMATVFISSSTDRSDVIRTPFSELGSAALPTMVALMAIVLSTFAAMVTLRLRKLRDRDQNVYSQKSSTDSEKESGHKIPN